MILDTANRFFTGYKKYSTRIIKQDQTMLEYQMKLLLASNASVGYHLSDQENPQLYFGQLDAFAEQLVKAKKGVIFYNEGFVFGMIGDPTAFPEKDFKEYLEKIKKEGTELKYKGQNSVKVDKKKSVDAYKFTVFHKFTPLQLTEYLNKDNFMKL